MRVAGATAGPSACHSVEAEKFGRIFRIVGFAAAALVAALSSQALSQPAPIVNQGQLVVTGYSGSEAVAPPAGADPFDYLRIRLDGPSARVVDVRVLGPQGQLSSVAKPFTVTAAQVGQVFGVTLDNAPQPNIYLAATSAFGLAIAVADPSGQPKRVRKGEPGAQWMPGQFGPPAFGGAPGSIWRIDGTTGAVTLFANIETASVGAASLGGLAFDPVTQQIFAADRSTGLVYRFSLDGVQRGIYDHGTEGRGPAGLPPVPGAGISPVNIASPGFDTESPATWGFAAPARRVYALAVRNNRLYYSVQQQVWSVGISPSGAVAAGPRIEIEAPALQDGIEIASIAFDGEGRMYLAERGATTGDYFRYFLANGGAARVLRYLPKPPADPSPGLWRLIPEQYSVGQPPTHANGNGGVALGYGYRQDNVIDFNACRATVWSTGERLLDPGNPAIPPESYPHVDGLQGNASSLVQPQNTPPASSWFVDYDDLDGDPNYRGHMGAIAVMPCPGAPTLPPPPPPPPVTCPPGTYFFQGQCVIIPTCPPGTYYENGQCYYIECPPGLIQTPNGQCVPPPVSCPPGTVYYQGQCYPIGCPPGLIQLPNGQCGCPPGLVWYQGQCVPPQNCPPGMVQLPGGICWCPLGTIFGDGFCKPSDCPPGQIMDKGFCKPCPAGQEVWKNQCKPKCKLNEFRAPDGTCKPLQLCLGPNKEIWNGKCVDKCPIGQFHTQPNGECKPLQLCLGPNKEIWQGKCVDKCPIGQFHTEPNGECKPLQLCLGPNKEIWNGKCVDKCPPGQIHTPPDGACKLQLQLPELPLCIGPNKEVWNGKCVNKCPPGQIHTPPDGACKLQLQLPELPLCIGPNKEVWNGKCVNKCPPGQVHTPPNGACKALDLQLPGGVGPILPKPPIVLPQPPEPVPPPGPGPVLPDFKLPGGIKLPGVIGPLTPPEPPAGEGGTPPAGGTTVNPQLTLPPGALKVQPGTVTPTPTPEAEKKVEPQVVPQLQLQVPILPAPVQPSQ